MFYFSKVEIKCELNDANKCLKAQSLFKYFYFKEIKNKAVFLTKHKDLCQQTAINFSVT